MPQLKRKLAKLVGGDADGKCIRIPAYATTIAVHMIGFSSKREAMTECDRLNSRSFSLVYFIKKANVFHPQEDK